MKELIDSFGLNNFIIIVSVVVAILLALIVIFVVEKISKKKNKDILEYYYDNDDEDDDEDDIDADLIQEEKEEENNDTIEPIEEPIVKEVEKNSDEDRIIYKQDTLTRDQAKKTLEEVTKKLVEEDEFDIAGPTSFEMEQEEKSVISYDELKKINYDIDEVNDNLLLDQGNEPITIEELYKKHLEEQADDIDENPIFISENQEEAKESHEEKIDNKKFKNSEVISPVFGVYNKNYKEVKDINNKKDVKEHDLELEIRKTEEFLEELKKLKDKLD